MPSHGKHVTLCCRCGSDQFEYDDGNLSAGIRCTRCSRKYSQQTLERQNRSLLEKEAHKMAEKALSDIHAKLTKRFR